MTEYVVIPAGYTPEDWAAVGPQMMARFRAEIAERFDPVLADPKDKYDKPIPDGEVPPNEGPEPTQDELEDSGDDPAETE